MNQEIAMKNIEHIYKELEEVEKCIAPDFAVEKFEKGGGEVNNERNSSSRGNASEQSEG